MAVRSSCPDLICGSLLFTPSGNITIPFTNSTVNPGNIPSNPFLVRSLLVTNITGFYNIDKKSTRLDVYADSGPHPGTGFQTRVSYDFTGDGSWDRIEVYDLYAPNDLTGYEV